MLLSVHDLSFPGDGRDDVGRGAPLSRGGRAFAEFAADLGFHGLQLGPQGETTPFDPSPYDATLFSRGIAAISLQRLVDGGLLPEEHLARAADSRPEGALLRAEHGYAEAATREALRAAWLRSRGDRAIQQSLREFSARHKGWLAESELHAVLEAAHRAPDWNRWPSRDRALFSRDPPPDAAQRQAELRAAGAEEIELFRFGQLLAHEQHATFRSEARRLGLSLWGDLQIGISQRDLWAYGHLLLPALRMGAPPSRTNPEGQVWGYGVLDPRLYGARDAPGPALAFLRARAEKLLEEFDGLRVDHPHGLIDPWVYSTADSDGIRAVQNGARLFSSPERAELAAWAIATPDQIDLTELPHADGRVRALAPDQVARYAILFDALVAAAGERGIIAEVLSTQPLPVGRVLERHGLGRFRVTQKAALRDPSDVYRGENARPQDWIMVGTHDTEPIWRVAERWTATGAAEERAAYLATRLVVDASARAEWIRRVAASPRALARAQLADLFVGPARNVMIFFSDLLGLREIYNRPGTVGAENWSLRIPPDFAVAHARAAEEGSALDLPGALAAAIRARGVAFAAGQRELLERLEAAAGPGPDAC